MGFTKQQTSNWWPLCSQPATSHHFFVSQPCWTPIPEVCPYRIEDVRNHSDYTLSPP